MSIFPSALTLLKSRAAAPKLCLPTSKPFQAASTAARHLNKFTFAELLQRLATSSNVLQRFRPVLLGSPIPPTRWQELVATSDDLAALPPDMLADRSSFIPPRADKFTSRPQIEDHCLGLLMRSPGNTVDDIQAIMAQLLKPFDVSLDRHITTLSDLKRSNPKLAIAIMEDRTVLALRLVKGTQSPEQRDAAVRIVIRHWLLYRAFHLQRAAAYIASCRRSALPFFRSSVSFTDTVANTAMAFVDVLAKGASVFIGGYLRSLETGGKAGTPGRTTLPIEFARAVIDQHGVRPVTADEPAFALTLDQHGPTLMERAAGIVDVALARRRDGLAGKTSLYAAAGEKAPKAKALTMFEMWHSGLSPAAMLLVVATRYVEAAKIVEAVLNNPALVWSGSDAIAVEDKSDAYVVDVARNKANAIMGDAAPSLANTTKPRRLAKAFLRLHMQRDDSSRPLKADMMEAFDPMLDAHWPAMPSPTAICQDAHPQARRGPAAKRRRAT